MAEILSGGLNWGSTQQAIVTMDKEGHPLTCCNPVTGECLGGGGSSDFSTAEVTVSGDNAADCLIPYLDVTGDDSPQPSIGALNSIQNGTTFQIPLYKGRAYAYISSHGVNVAVSGNIEAIANRHDEYFITGDCVITLTTK